MYTHTYIPRKYISGRRINKIVNIFSKLISILHKWRNAYTFNVCKTINYQIYTNESFFYRYNFDRINRQL